MVGLVSDRGASSPLFLTLVFGESLTTANHPSDRYDYAECLVSTKASDHPLIQISEFSGEAQGLSARGLKPPTLVAGLNLAGNSCLSYCTLRCLLELKGSPFS